MFYGHKQEFSGLFFVIKIKLFVEDDAFRRQNNRICTYFCNAKLFNIQVPELWQNENTL